MNLTDVEQDTYIFQSTLSNRERQLIRQSSRYYETHFNPLSRIRSDYVIIFPAVHFVTQFKSLLPSGERPQMGLEKLLRSQFKSLLLHEE